jgi:hypothetical protein
MTFWLNVVSCPSNFLAEIHAHQGLRMDKNQFVKSANRHGVPFPPLRGRRALREVNSVHVEFFEY